jgi:hypothetical protein
MYDVFNVRTVVGVALGVWRTGGALNVSTWTDRGPLNLAGSNPAHVGAGVQNLLPNFFCGWRGL